jgi:hypothetical protein
MARKGTGTRREQLAVSVDSCRVRLQTGEEILFVDARKPEDWAASERKIAGAIRLLPGQCPAPLPCPKHNYLVVYCA